jgi:hypothetical protein
LNSFDFDKILNSDFQLFLISSLVNFCSATMASKKHKEKIESQPLVSKPESTSSLSSLPIFIDPPIYISLPFSQHLFYMEKNHSHIKSPKQLILSYFPPDFRWIPEHPQKNLIYYTNILIQTKSIHIKPIFSKTFDSPKLSGSLVSITNFISEKEWGTHPSTLRSFVYSNIPYSIPYSYYDYIDAWTKFMLFQTSEFNHFWFIKFDKNFKGIFPLWFLHWWNQFGLTPDTLPQSLLNSFHLFKTLLNPKDFDFDFPPILHFAMKYKIPWFLAWRYTIKGFRVERHWFQAKLRDDSAQIDFVINDVKKLVSKAPVKISPYSDFSRYSDISKKKELIKSFMDSMDSSSDKEKKELIKTFLDSMDDSSDEDEEDY